MQNAPFVLFRVYGFRRTFASWFSNHINMKLINNKNKRKETNYE